MDLLPARFVCPWNSPGKNTAASVHSLLQETFQAQRSSLLALHLLHLQEDSLPSAPLSLCVTPQAVQMVTNLPASAGDARDMCLIPGPEDLLEQKMATLSSILVLYSTEKNVVMFN